MATRLVNTLGLAAWSLVVLAMTAAVWGIVNRRSRTRTTIAGVVVLLALVGLGVVAFAGIGAFCVPPPGAACA